MLGAPQFDGHWICWSNCQGCILPPCPQGHDRHGQGVFCQEKKLMKGFSLMPYSWFQKKTWEKSYLCLPQQVKRGYSRTFFLANSWLLRKESQQLQDLIARARKCSHERHITPPWQWLEAEVKLVEGNCSLPHPRSLLLHATSYPPFQNNTKTLKIPASSCLKRR